MQPLVNYTLGILSKICSSNFGFGTSQFFLCAIAFAEQGGRSPFRFGYGSTWNGSSGSGFRFRWVLGEKGFLCVSVQFKGMARFRRFWFPVPGRFLRHPVIALAGSFGGIRFGMQMRLFNHFKIIYLNDFMHSAVLCERLGPLQERKTQQPSNRGKICQTFSKNTIFGMVYFIALFRLWGCFPIL